MVKITKSLVMEHAIFCAVFDQIEQILPGLNSVREVQVLTTIVEGLLGRHANVEKDLAFATLDHVLAEQGNLDRLHQDHRELDRNYARVHDANSLAQARRLLKMALAASRKHFRFEEREVFPLLERVLPGETLADLGETRLQEYLSVNV